MLSRAQHVTSASTFGLDLLQGALAGDARATRDLVREVLIPVAEAGICQESLRLRRARIDVEDALQEVLEHLHENGWARLRSFDPSRGTLAGYVSRIARNLTIDLLRRRPPPEPVEDTELVASDAPPDSGPESKVRLGEQLDRLAAALGEEDLLLVRWLWFEGLDREEIAARLGLSSAALYKRSQRLEAKVRGVLSNDGHDDRTAKGASM
ncbi:MAG: sigma-70 family RNA polymerase sigma factor [Polyangiaceae bacterium]